MPDQKRILFLYTELANYFLVCIKQLRELTNHEIHIVHWPINAEAPFQLELEIKNTIFYPRQNYSHDELNKLVSQISPHLIYCSGWIDKEYTKVCSMYKNKIPVVGGFDTPWNGSIKQQLHSILSGMTVKKYFSHLWIAGKPQLKYAQKLGFDSNHILENVYSADVPHFDKIYNDNLIAKSQNLPKRFIFAGRYLEFKGIFDLWQAFIKTFDHCEHDWELWCIGTGALWDKRTQHPKIKHIGFVQPKDMDIYMAQTSVFVLPSHFEPWAVALHEFASAGFPLISSNKVGSITKFLIEGQNGFVFNSGNVDELTTCFLRYIQMPSPQILEFGKQSNSLAKLVTPTTWSNTISNLL